MRYRLLNSFLTDICRFKNGITLSATSRKINFHTSCSCHVVYKSVYPDIDIPKMTITELILKDFNNFGMKTATIDAISGRSISFDGVKDGIWRIASGMSKQGFRKGDVLMMISENSIDFILVLHAVLSLGGIVTTCNNHYLVDDILRQAQHSKTSYIYCSQLTAVKAKVVSSKLRNIKKVFVSGHEEGFVPISFLLEDDGVDFPTSPPADPMSTAILPYSSGTTGLPKGVMLSHYNLVASCHQVDIPGYFPEKGKDTQLAILPFYHVYGIIFHWLNLLRKGFTSIVMTGFEPVLFLETIQKYKVNMTHIVPPIVTFLVKHEMVSKYDLRSLCRITSGAAPLGFEILQTFKEKYPWCSLTQGYGMTELTAIVSVCSPKDKLTSSGRLVANTLAKVVDVDNKELPPGKVGEIHVKGPQVMMGYLNNPKATSDTIDTDGWLHTGDMAYIDEDGYLFVVDRIKELIKFKGMQVPPAELEDILCSHPCVADAAVVGLPDSEAGELPKAFVTLKEGTETSVEELQQFVNKRVVSYKRLRGGISFLSLIPRSPSGKILRKELRTK